jgi:hypothetical protein
MTSTDGPRWATTKATREYLGVSEATFWRHVRDGRYKRYGTGKATMFDLNEVDRAVRGELHASAAVSDVISMIRERLTYEAPKSLIPYAHVHDVINRVAAELGVE